MGRFFSCCIQDTVSLYSMTMLSLGVGLFALIPARANMLLDMEFGGFHQIWKVS